MELLLAFVALEVIASCIEVEKICEGMTARMERTNSYNREDLIKDSHSNE